MLPPPAPPPSDGRFVHPSSACLSHRCLRLMLLLWLILSVQSTSALPGPQTDARFSPTTEMADSLVVSLFLCLLVLQFSPAA